MKSLGLLGLNNIHPNSYSFSDIAQFHYSSYVVYRESPVLWE